MRRCPEDDQWVVPHELHLAMFSPSTVNVLPFDPRHGADQARQYANKYASKSEKWYFLETERDGVKDFLKCRTVGLCMAHNRLLKFHVVRTTRPVRFLPNAFIPGRDARTSRDPSHVLSYPEYPDREWYLNFTQKYFFRHPYLRHLRLEQFNRYLSLTSEVAGPLTLEDTIGEDDAVPPDTSHRHYDEIMEAVEAGSTFPSAKHVNGARRRKQGRLGIGRVPFIEPFGEKRESFYEQRLILSLPWYCPTPPAYAADGSAEWRFVWDPSEDDLGEARLEQQQLTVAPGRALSFETTCADLEKEFCRHEHALVCRCCTGELKGSTCGACMYAVGFHRCQNTENRRHLLWRRGALHGGPCDIQRVLFNLHRKGLPTNTIRDKAAEYAAAGLVSEEQGTNIVRHIEQERKVQRMVNEVPDELEAAPGSAGLCARMTRAQLEDELRRRVENLKKPGRQDATSVPDQWRVYHHIIQSIEAGNYLRLFVQASAGTGHIRIILVHV
jgi:hypothetical protein